ncbi:MAG: hypothetical protein ACF8CQ_22330 [Rhodopirellula sp. JB044]|uniref:hypothetical protein n=1 Tax=Rhodopirellula sp. JB044 TaxID=3342844 RepID=UPI00370BF486
MISRRHSRGGHFANTRWRALHPNFQPARPTAESTSHVRLSPHKKHASTLTGKVNGIGTNRGIPAG